MEIDKLIDVTADKMLYYSHYFVLINVQIRVVLTDKPSRIQRLTDFKGGFLKPISFVKSMSIQKKK